MEWRKIDGKAFSEYQASRKETPTPDPENQVKNEYILGGAYISIVLMSTHGIV